MQPAGVRRLHLNQPVPLKTKKPKAMFWASEFYGDQFFGYAAPNSGNSAPTCTVGSSSAPVDDVNGTGSDAYSNIVVPGYTGTGSYLTVNVYKAGTCGTVLGAPQDSGGQPADADSNGNVATGANIVVGELANYTTEEGDVLICSLTSCGTPITSSNITGYGAGVAVDKAGDCWMSAETSGNASATLAYWPGCTGAGETATGFSNAYYGGLFIDKKGDLGSVDLSGYLYVYKGCDPKCKTVSKTTLKGESLFGNLNAKGDELVVGDFENGTCDVYTYSPKGSTFQYSFDSGLTTSDDVESCINSPKNAPK
jgi:hypothetical protein